MEAQFVIGSAAEVVGNLASEYASLYFSYFFRFGKIVEDFKIQRNILELKKARLKNDIDEAERKNEVIQEDVKMWLTEAEKELGEAQSLEDEIERNKCFNWCPSWGWHYSLSKKVAKKTLCISKLLETCNFQRIGQRPPLQEIESLLPKDLMPSESSTLALNGIMKALKSDGVNVIGLYGMPGVGKTTLALVAGKQALEQKLFDKVMIVWEVSQNPDINIRERIAGLFGLEFNAITEEGKAEELCWRFKDEEKILIILDDVWKKLNLRNIGIPFGSEHEGCKILLTTRLQQVCSQMDCQEEFKLNIQSDDEAWALFKNEAGVEDDSPTLNVAKDVARECNGLPLAIVTVAKALKYQSLDVWVLAYRGLKSSGHLDNQDVVACIYARLKLSYDYLDQNNIKQCFLLCSLFPEDYEISIELLIIFGIGQGLFNNNSLIEDSRNEICQALLKLQQSGLLLETDDEKFVKMHNVVRKFAHWITSRGENMFMVKDGLRKWPSNGSFSCYTAISLWNNEIVDFPDKMEFPKLKILLLKGENSLRVPCTFFERMTTLQVLLLQDSVFSLEAFQSLINLRTLCFIDCKLENISSLRNLKNLKIFALLNTNIHELPEELVELSGPSNVPPNLLSRLTSLQELHVANENNVNLLELNSVSRLTGLTLRVSTDQYFQENCVFPKRRSANIVVEFENMEGLTSGTLRISDLFCNVKSLTLTDVNMKHKNSFSRCLAQSVMHVEQLKISTYSKLDQVFAFAKEMVEQESLLPTLKSILKEPTHASLQSLKDVTIQKCDGLKSIFSPWLAQSLMHLEQLEISQCNKLEQVFAFAQEMTEQEENQTAPLSNLRSLMLRSLPALESIWKEPTHHASLQNLKDLIVEDCDKLISIFSPWLAQSLMHLEQLEISQCNKLEQVFAFAQEMAEQEITTPSSSTCLELKSLPKLRSLTIARCKSLEYVFPITLAQGLPNFESLVVIDCPQLMHVFGRAKRKNGPEAKEMDRDGAKEMDWHDIVLPQLKDLRLENLERLGAIDCPQLVLVFGRAKRENGPEAKEMDRDEAKKMDRHEIVLPQLKDLRLENLERLRSFCPKNYFVEFPSLKDRSQ